jgi:hypothetical protein
MSTNGPIVLSPTINTLQTGIYTGSYYAFTASGGYELEQGFDTIRFVPFDVINQYDMTGSIQVKFDVRTFNKKLGIIKDASNIVILDSSYIVAQNLFPIDSISISSEEFVSGMKTSQVISVGKYSTMYSDFTSYVNTYFGYAGGFASLFSKASLFDINHGVFDASAFLLLITGGISDGSGAYISNMSGSITISDINKTLRYAIDTNIFGNRNPTANTGTAYDPSNNEPANYGMIDGFIEGDLIFIPGGTHVTLKLNIDSEAFLPLNNVGVSNVATLTQTTNSVNGNFSINTTATTTNITRILTAPILIQLTNLS